MSGTESAPFRAMEEAKDLVTRGSTPMSRIPCNLDDFLAIPKDMLLDGLKAFGFKESDSSATETLTVVQIRRISIWQYTSFWRCLTLSARRLRLMQPCCVAIAAQGSADLPAAAIHPGLANAALLHSWFWPAAPRAQVTKTAGPRWPADLRSNGHQRGCSPPSSANAALLRS